jgi:hypothetical protein
MKQARFFSFILVVTLSSCEKVLDKFTLEEVNSYDSYYPVNIGYWIDYRVDSTSYVKSGLDPQPIVTETTGFIRELIEDTIIGFDTPVQYKVKVFSRKSLSDPWVFQKNKSIQPHANFITQNESNLRLIKLYSPINPTVSWKGNKFIDTSITKLYADWDYRYIDLFQSKTILSIRFDSTITVLQYLDTNAIEKTHFFETYAPRVGLIYAEYHKLEKQNVLNSWNNPENGYTIVRRVIDWKR